MNEELLLSAIFGLSAVILIVAVLSRKLPKTFTARVVWVCDGDSIWVRQGFCRIKLRLCGIDAPESKQRYGKESREYLLRLINGKRVIVHAVERDIYGRVVSQIICNGNDICLAMLEAGLAWPYYRYFHILKESDRRRYKEAAQNAKQARLGLWSETKAQAPWT